MLIGLPNIPSFISPVSDGVGNYLLFGFSGATAWLFDFTTNSVIREYTPGHGAVYRAEYLHVLIIKLLIIIVLREQQLET